MFSDVDLQLIYRISNAPVRSWPFPHCVVEEIFPSDFYRYLRSQLPPSKLYADIGNTGYVGRREFQGRSIFELSSDNVNLLEKNNRTFWSKIITMLSDREMVTSISNKFSSIIQQRIVGGKLTANTQIILVKDRAGYQIGPHTDLPARLVSLLFYLPPNSDIEAHGTSVYIPKDRGFSSDGSVHHDRRDFDLVETVPFRMNSVVFFPRTERSFHGVELIRDAGIARDSMLVNIMQGSAA